MDILIMCDCRDKKGNPFCFFANPETMTVKETEGGPIVSVVCPNCHEKQVAFAKKVGGKKVKDDPINILTNKL